MSELAKRILTAGIAGGLLVAFILYDAAGTLLFCILVPALMVIELTSMFGIRKMGYILTLMWMAILAIPVFFSGNLMVPLACIPFASSLAYLIRITSFKHDESLAKHSLILLLTPLYIFLPFLVFLHLATNTIHPLYTGFFADQPKYAPMVAIGILLLVWINDSFAYFAGRLFGKNKLAPAISPKKTWEGFAGGFLFAVAGGIMLEFFYGEHISWISAGVITGVLNPAGDLFESLMKRFSAVKDSGNLLPGHGGLLDRFDGFVFTVPAIWALELIMSEL